MMQDDYIEKPEDNLLMRLSDLDEDFSIGIINHFHAYVHRVSPGVLKIENDKVSYKQGVITEKYINNYLNKTSVDFSAKDCAYLAINRVGIPPELKDHINPDAVRMMKQLHGIDMEDTQYNKLLTDIPEPDVVIFMGCNVSCPNVPSQYAENWGLDDPSGQNDEVFTETIKKIEEKVLKLKEKLTCQ